MPTPWKWTVSPNPTGKCYSGIDKNIQKMQNFISYVKTTVYPNNKPNWHMLNKYFCSRFNDKTEYYNAYVGFHMFH